MTSTSIVSASIALVMKACVQIGGAGLLGTWMGRSDFRRWDATCALFVYIGLSWLVLFHWLP